MGKYSHLSNEELIALRDQLRAQPQRNDRPPISVPSSDQTSLGAGIGKSVLGGIVGLGRSFPGSDLASALVGLMGDYATAPFKGKPVNDVESFKRHYAFAKKIGQDIEQQAPIASAIGRGFGTTTQFMAGMGMLPEVSGLGKIGSVIQKLARPGLINAIVGQGQGVDTSKIPTDISLGSGGALLGQGLAKAGEAAIPAASRLINSALKPSLRELERSPNIGEEMAARNIWGVSKKSLYKQAQAGLKEYGNQLSNALQGKGNIDPQIVASEMEDVAKFYDSIPGRENEAKIIRDKMSDFMKRGSLSAEEANKVKQNIYQLRQKMYGRDVIPAQAEAEMGMARGIRKATEAIAPETAGINKELGVFSRLKDIIESAQARGQKSSILPLRSILLGMGAGGMMGPEEGLGATIGSSMAGTTGVKTGGAILIKKLLEAMGRTAPIAKYAAPFSTGAMER